MDHAILIKSPQNFDAKLVKNKGTKATLTVRIKSFDGFVLFKHDTIQ